MKNIKNCIFKQGTNININREGQPEQLFARPNLEAYLHLGEGNEPKFVSENFKLRWETNMEIDIKAYYD